jgi:anti-sigma B factor antagonist
MQIDERSAGNVTVLALKGELKLGDGLAMLKDKVQSLLHQGRKNVLVDLGGVTYIDSSGIGELASAYTSVVKAGGHIKLLNLTKRVKDLLAITKLLTVFDSFDAEQDALRSYGIGPQ